MQAAPHTTPATRDPFAPVPPHSRVAFALCAMGCAVMVFFAGIGAMAFYEHEITPPMHALLSAAVVEVQFVDSAAKSLTSIASEKSASQSSSVLPARPLLGDGQGGARTFAQQILPPLNIAAVLTPFVQSLAPTPSPAIIHGAPDVSLAQTYVVATEAAVAPPAAGVSNISLAAAVAYSSYMDDAVFVIYKNTLQGMRENLTAAEALPGAAWDGWTTFLASVLTQSPGGDY